MASKILEITITVVVTVAVTVAVSWFVERGLQHGNRQLYGRWYSSWQPNPGDSKWVTEIVDIQFNWRSLWFNLAKYRGRLRLTNSKNSDGYLWRAYADVIGRRDIVGVWHSLHPGSHSHRVLAFAIQPQGRYLYGYYVGPSDDDRTVLRAFVLGRTDHDVESAKQRLWSCRIKGVQSAKTPPQ